ncbi:MAG: TrkA family potassium uptake protein [Bacillota bacterium]|nr:TrkA family potassium uptake protein [Bacillota bacterium]
MQDKSIVVFGAGRFGSALAQELFNENLEVMIVDKDQERIQNLATKVTTGIITDIKDEDAIEELGLKNFDIAVVAIGSDLESSIMATVAAREHGIETIYAKAPSEMYGRILLKVGADYIIYPEREIAERLARSIAGSSLMEYINFSGEYSIAEIKAPKDWANKRLKDLDIRSEQNIMVIGIKRMGQMIISPKADQDILPTDRVIVLARYEDIEDLAEND